MPAFDHANDGPLTPLRAGLLGVVQGPAELLPISSTAHLGLVPKLGGWEWDRLDDGLRKDFEVALHAGAALALALDGIGLVRAEIGPGRRRGATAFALALLPAALAGFLAEDKVARHGTRPGVVAAGLFGGALVMLAADRRRQWRPEAERIGPADGLALGISQACALLPGVSRNGATLAVARWRGFRRSRADEISAAVGLPVIAGATALKTFRGLQRRRDPAARNAVAAGAAAAFLSTVLAAKVVGRRPGGRALTPFALYRIGLAAVIWYRNRPVGTGGEGQPGPAGIGSRIDE